MTYEFDSYELDTITRELRCAGSPVRVEPKVFDFLVLLLEHPGEVISKEELIEAIWKGRFISDAAISSCVSAARKALNDDGRLQRYIKTVHGRGVRFVGNVTETYALTAAKCSAPAPKEIRVVVLSFVNVGRDDPSGSLAQAISASVETEIARFRHIKLQPTGMQQAPRSATSSGMKFGGALDADFILSGSVHVFESRIRVTAHLIDCGGGRHVWAERFDGTLDDSFDLVDKCSRSIAATAAGRINATGHARTLQRDVSKLSVDDLIRRAQANYDMCAKAALIESLPILERAKEVNPSNARAFMLLGAFYDMAYWTGWMDDPADCLQRAVEYGQKAVELDPTDALAHAHLGEALLHARRITEARSKFDRARKLNPNDVAANTLYAAFLTATGNPEAALKQLEVIDGLDPFGLNWIPWMRAEACFSLGRYDDAVAALQSFDSLINNARLLLAASYAFSDRTADARRTLSDFITIAELEMEPMPKSLQEWHAFLDRESNAQDADSFDRLFDGLLRSGLEEFTGVASV